MGTFRLALCGTGRRVRSYDSEKSREGFRGMRVRRGFCGGRIADLELKLVTSDQTTVFEAHTDAKENFRFAALHLGTYVMTSGTPGWTVDGWPIQMMSS